jgi:hypothetical protein
MFEEKSVEDLTYAGREILDRLAWLASSIMMVEDASRDGDAVATELARRWIWENRGVATAHSRARVAMDRLIAFPEPVRADAARL